MQSTHQIPEGSGEKRFSLLLFVLTLAGTLAVMLLALRFLAPATWVAQFAAPLWKALVAFLVLSLANCFVEYFFHRYVLHAPVLPFLSYFYRRHTLHHGLTHIVRKPGPDRRSIPFIENRFPIVHEEQFQAAFFPWYTLAVFGLLACPPLALLQYVFPSFPWWIAGFCALASSLSFYEILHAINHWPFERWSPLLNHARWGFLWRKFYSFHLRHHAVVDSNESISGFFGLPVADWVFGTCVFPRTIYEDGEPWTAEKFQRPHPVALIRWLDSLVERAVRRRRRKTAASGSSVAGRGSPAPPPQNLPAEESTWENEGGHLPGCGS